MQLRNQVEWALHCCAILAGLPEARFLSTKDLAKLHGVPKEYLGKALQALSQAGLVEGTLGPSGGYRLAREAAGITFLDIVEAVEGKSSSFVCTEIRKNNPCRTPGMRKNGPCAIARVMWDADRAWRERLAAVSLADLARTLADELPPDQIARMGEWIEARS
ncbi:MAG: Rrf2 family transcriptional regulator [Alphaproteobacteria bacterium]|nr:Rrf2 family transcriptional regulator [Alphaproteobacteria bacterium]